MLLLLRKHIVSGSSLDGHIISGRTAVDMPEIPLAPMQNLVLACNTGPGAGLTQLGLDPDPDDCIDKSEFISAP